MAIIGNFVDFSLPELLLFLEPGKKTGVLYIEFSPDNIDNSTTQTYYIWLHQGLVIAAAERLDQKGLTLMIDQRGWISERVMSRVMHISAGSINTPLGLFLKSQGLLQPEQLKLLFHAQILRPICNLFQTKNGLFKFNEVASLPMPLTEMTGLNMSATEVTLICLRFLRDWSALAQHLPQPTSGLSSLSVKQPQIRLNPQESQVWEFVNGNVSLQEIAHHIKIPLETVQQIAYRLIVIGITKEDFMVAPLASSTSIVTTEELVQEKSSLKSAVSQSFLTSLVGFLRNKGASVKG